MTKSVIEALTETKKNRGLPELQSRAQINALKNLVTITNEKLKSNMESRFNCEDPNQDVFDAFFSVPEFNGVMMLSSAGSPDSVQDRGLFVYIDYKDEVGSLKRLIGWQTAKVPNMVDRSEAEWLSRYTPKQVGEVARLVKTGNPITRETYRAYMEKPKVPEGIE